MLQLSSPLKPFVTVTLSSTTPKPNRRKRLHGRRISSVHVVARGGRHWCLPHDAREGLSGARHRSRAVTRPVPRSRPVPPGI
eukprot:scaffold109140_cov63-Phaeocystis_antarctica.AAC.1